MKVRTPCALPMAGIFTPIATALLFCALATLGACTDMGTHARAPAVAPPPLPLASVASRAAAKRPVPTAKPRNQRTVDAPEMQPKLALRRDQPPAIEPESLLGLDPDAVYEVEGEPAPRSGAAWEHDGLLLTFKNEFSSTMRHIRKV